MDVSALRSRLASLQNPRAGKGDLVKTLWGPTIGKQQVRILPSMYNKSNPFKELYFHYGIGGKTTMIALSNFGEKDPINEFAQSIRKSSVKEDWQLAKKLEAKMRVFVPVIVRGEEEKGVLLWGFGKQVYMDLLALAEDEDVGDFTDPISGRDITIDTQGKETTGLMYNTSSVRVRTKETPISDDAEKVKQWLTTQPDPVTQFKKHSYEEMKTALMNHLNPEEEIKQTADAVVDKTEMGAAPWDTKPATEKPAAFTLNTSKSEVDKKIDDLFAF
jgi:hypothetical protein